MGPMLTAGAGSPRGWESSVEPLARSLPTGTIPEVPQQATDMKSFNKMMEARGKKEEKQREKAQKDYYKTGITEQKMFAAAAKDERIKAEKAKKEQDKLLKQAEKEALKLATNPKTAWDLWLTKQAAMMGKLDNFKAGSRQSLDLLTAIKHVEMTKGRAAAEKALLMMIDKRMKQRKKP